MTTPRPPWWKGTRGEWYLAVQLALFALVAYGPRTRPGWPAWTFPPAPVGHLVGVVLVVIGALLVASGILRLGKHLSPLPHPTPGAPLYQNGPYRFVRHPVYCGGIFMAFGWALWVRGWLTLLYAVLLFLFLDVKARREERWLRREFPEYAGYQARVRKLVPFVY